MINKAINTLVLATVDSITKFKNKLAYYLAIFAMVFGSTFGSLNSAVAVEIADGLTSAEADLNGLAITTADDVTTHTIDLDDGDITVLSILGDQADPNTITITNSQAATGTFTVSGDVESDEDIIFLSGDKETTFVFSGNMTEDGGDGKDLFIQLDEDASTTFNGVTKNIDAQVDGIVDGEGTMNVSAASGTLTFDGALGAVKELKALNVTSAATFNAAADVEAVTITADASMEAALKADTVSVTDAVLTLKALAIDTDVGTEVLVITLNDTASTGQVSFVSGAAVDITGTIEGAAAGEGKIVVAQGSGGAGNETTFKGAIGGVKKVGAIEVGSTTLSGLADFEAAVITDSLSVIGGDNGAEDSQIDVGASITSSSGGITLTPGAGDAKLLVTANATLTGAIDKSGSGDGDAIIAVSAGTLTLASEVGSTTAIDSFTLVDSTAAAINGDFSATTTLITDAATITYDKASDQTHTGAITVAANDDGTLVNANTDGELTFSSTVGATGARLTDISLNDNSITNFNGAFFSKTLDIDNGGVSTTNIVIKAAGNAIGIGNAGALQIETGTTIELGTAIGNTDTVFNTALAANNDTGVLIEGATTIKPSANFTSGTITFIDGDADNLDLAAEQGFILVQDTALTDFSVSTTKQDVTITATAKSDATTASELSVTTNNAKSLRQAIESANTGSSSDSAALTALNDSLVVINGRSATDDTELAKQVAPQDDMISGSTFATKAMTGSLQGIMSNRMASLRSGDAFMTGMSAGNGMSANSGFIQAFGTEAEQKNKTVGSGTQFGYDASSAGLAFCFDGITDYGSVVGLSFSMSQTDVDGKGSGNSKNDIDSYTASIYMDKSTDAGYVEGSLTVGLNENNSSRIVNTAGLNRTYKGDYDSEQVSLKIGGGKPNAVGMSGYVTPFGSITATRISTDTYTETSTTANDNLRLRVAQDDVDSIVGTIGLKYHNVLDNGGSPMISLAINNEFGDSTINSTNTYQGGGSSFKTSTDVEELSATLGLGYSFSSDNASIEFAYEADVNDDDYLGHYGSIKLVSKF